MKSWQSGRPAFHIDPQGHFHLAARTLFEKTFDVSEFPIRKPGNEPVDTQIKLSLANCRVAFDSCACWLLSCLGVAAVFLLQNVPTQAQSSLPDRPAEVSVRLDRLESSLRSLEQDNRRLFEKIRDLEQEWNLPSLSEAEPALSVASPVEHLSQAEASFALPDDSDSAAPIYEAYPLPQQTDAQWSPQQYRVGYDNGFVIVPNNRDNLPFSLKINSQNVFRYEGFARGASSWIDSSGNQNAITNSNNFQIPRGRLIFSGKVLLPQLSYLLNIDYNTVTNNPIGFRAYVLSYQFSRGLEMHMGQSKVPGTREWIESAFAPLEGPDRSMATTFFRPSLSQGIWVTGEPIDGWHYHAMMSNGYNTLNLRPSQLNNQFCWSGSTWWEPWGEFGRGYADLQNHETAVGRFGTSYTIARGQGSQSASDAVENSSIRLSNGTLITQAGAFAPGVTLQSYDISLAAVDFALKYRGLSLSTEWFAQNLFSLEGDGPLPINSTQAYGGMLQGGFFVVPREVELYSRTSFVTGRYGSGSEIAGGLNWFILPGKSDLRFTFDTAWLDSSPADQNRTGFAAGQTGLLIRTQITVNY